MSNPSLVEEIFLTALEKSPEERSAYLDSACQNDPELRHKVDRLLAAYPKVPGFLEVPGIANNSQTVDFQPPVDRKEAVIVGRYKLLEKIGEGGMGEVWVAEQTVPVRRKVALKLIKAGMDSKTVLARFEAERQALAVMDHPNIAKVLDGGLTEQGRPYFVMEYFKGVPITEYCDAARLSVQERLRLFTQVCQAVQHAHQKGIIHRDLKPSNILVAPYDDKPVPKVIDFGLAKAMHQSLTECTLHTAHGIVLGTPLYMSPEQAQLNNLDVDTRSDIYSLGVLLYELLTGTTPLEMKRFKEAAWDEVKRMIREEDPPCPSTRLSSTTTLHSLAAVRQLEAARLTKLVRGELDWIVMKALEKDRNRRYDTANGFAADVQRFLACETVLAAPPSAIYRLRKFARKNRALLATAGAFVGLLIVAAGVSGWLAVRATRAEVKAEEKRIEAVRNAQEAKEHAEEAGYYTKLFRETAEQQMIARHEAILSAASLQVDLDLLELRSDRSSGLLRLIQRSKEMQMQIPSTVKWKMSLGQTLDFQMPVTLFDRQRELQEFIASLALTVGQEFAPLLPPIRGQSIHLANGNPNLIALDEAGIPKLVDFRTGREIAVLQIKSEKIVNCDFSPDGKWVFTDDLQSVLRIWDGRDGRFIAALPRRENRYGNIKSTNDDWKKAVTISGNRAITRRSVVKQTALDGGGTSVSETWEGPVELWDISTGEWISRFDTQGTKIDQIRFENNGAIISLVENQRSILLCSSKTGKVIRRVALRGDAPVDHYAVSPTETRIAAISNNALQTWNVRTNELDSTPITWQGFFQNPVNCHFITDELIRVRTAVSLALPYERVFKLGQSEPLLHYEFTNAQDAVDEQVESADKSEFRLKNNLFDSQTGKLLARPANRKFHPLLAKYAKDGRYVFSSNWHDDGFTRHLEFSAVDTRSEKTFPIPKSLEFPRYVPKIGFVYRMWDGLGLMPTEDIQKIQPELLELWVRVAVRGELNDQGEFVKWTESKWERKRQELAAVPPPIKDFPFPGYVATDKLHWLRAEYNQTTDEAEKKRLAQELLRCSEESGDKIEAVRWRAVLKVKE